MELCIWDQNFSRISIGIPWFFIILPAFFGKTVLILSLNSQNCSKIPTELFLNFVCNFWKTLEQLLTPSLKNSNQKKLKTFWILKKPCCSTSKNSSQKFRNFVEILAKKQLISSIGHFLNFAGLFWKTLQILSLKSSAQNLNFLFH